MMLGHHSSRYDKSPESFEKAAKLAVDKCSLCTFTEVAGDKVAKAGRAKFESLGWDTWQPPPNDPVGSDENGVAWDTTQWALEERAHKKLSDKRYTREGGALAPFTVAQAGLFKRLENGDRWLIAVLHLPANTTDNNGCEVWWNGAGNSTRGAQFKESMKALGPWLQNLRGKWERGGASTIIGADWNQKCECAWWSNHVEDWMPGEFKNAGGPYPDTHGSSTYDWWIKGQKVKAAGDAKAFKTPASDHQLVVRKFTRQE
jgi:hypothetical protein